MKMVQLPSSSAILLALFLSSPLSAEPKVGRYADGTPYRIDNDGNEIVDQLAELELEKQNAQFRIQALERDLEEKENALQNGHSNQPEPKLYGAEEDEKRVTELAKLKQELRAAESEKQDLKNKLTRIEKGKESEEILLATSERKEKEIRALKDQLASYEQELEKSREALKGHEKRSILLGAELEKTGQELTRTKESVKTEQQRMLEEQQKAMYALKKKLERAKFENELLAEKVKNQTNPRIGSNEAYNGEISPRARYDFASSARSVKPKIESKPKLDPGMVAQAQRYITEIEGAVALRDRLFSEYNNKPGKVVSFRPRDLKATTGESFANLRARVHRVTTQGELTRAMGGLRSVLSLVRDDIALVQRLNK
jgi:hypothetical protein